MDQDIFDQLDMLERGARDIRGTQAPFHDSSTEYSAYDGYEQQEYGAYDAPYHQQPPLGDFADQPMQLDSFDERLMRLPDQDSRHAQAALGRARLSLPPARTSTREGFEPQPLQQHDLSRFAFDSGRSTSPLRAVQPSSPAFNASQRQPAPEGYETIRGHHEVPRIHPPRPQRLHQGFGDFETEHHAPQPSSRSQFESTFLREPAPAPHRAGAVTPIVQGIRLISTRQLPDRTRTVFSYPLFNAVQSKCYPVVYETNDNFVLSSPTGSGKTAVLELAICRLINGFGTRSFKIVYMAPTKSLCSERQRDWQAKFGPLDLQCAELTGDTDSAQLRHVQHASIIVTTPEKWDSVTRKWKDHQKLMQMVKLFLIDEVHILKEDRGATLEAVVSRMKSVGSDVRFVALSATVPNAQDIATWLSKDPANPHIPAPREKFGEEFRPVRLQKHVWGYQSNSNDFAFEKILNTKLTDVIAKWSQRKPLMVFCMTRNSCVETAKLLANWWSTKSPNDRYWFGPKERVVVVDKDLLETVKSGVAFHHAGLSPEDRMAVEKSYLSGEIGVICCTSTLAVGVNLPCHMVIIKNTVTYQQPLGCKEYSDLEIMQMLGRAGRPQFDDSAVAVIMTRLQRVQFYEKMVSGEEVLESCLHLNLIDHLNAEIGLGTITNASTARKWLNGTFLYVRLKDNPEYYKIEGDAPGRNLDERLENICRKAITLLEKNDLIRGTTKLQCTEFGDSMARYYIQFDTMQKILALPPKAKISEILSIIAQAAEFSDIRFRVGEKPVYRELNKNNAIKFPLPVQADSPAHKVSLVLQSVLGAIDLPTEDYKHRMEYGTCKAMIFQHVHRLIRCIIDCQLYLEDSISARNALMLARSFGAQVWDDSPIHIKQLEGVGLIYVRKFVAAGIRSIEDLENTEPHRIEQLLSRNPPFGREVQEKATAFPRLRVSMKAIGDPVIKKGEGVTVKVRAEIGFLNEKIPQTFQHKAVYACLLTDTSDGHKVHFARISAKKLAKGQEVLFSATLCTPGLTIRSFVMCDEIAGTQQTATLKPEIPAFMFPVPKPAGESSKQQGSKVDASRTSKRRAEAANQRRPSDDDDEFGTAGIEDADLAAAERDGYINIDDSDDDDKKHKSRVKPSSSQCEPSVEPAEPQKLENGKWACNHPCKDKTTCKHLCCRDGLDKKPRPSKPKESKKTEAGSDSRQTQLDLTKTKKSNAQSTQAPALTAPARKTVDTKETRDLNRVANSVKNTTPKIPLLGSQPASKFKTTQPLSFMSKQDDPSVEFGIGNLDSDDFPTDIELFQAKPPSRLSRTALKSETVSNDMSDEMLEIDLSNNNPTENGPGSGHVDLSSFSDGFGANHVDEWYMNDNASTQQHLNRPMSPLSSLENDLQARPISKGKSIFITGNSTDSVSDALGLSTLKRPLKENNNSNSFPPTKKQKSIVQPFGQIIQPGIPLDNAFLPDDSGSAALPDPSFPPQEPEKKKEEPELSVKEWFEKEFGTENFNFVG